MCSKPSRRPILWVRSKLSSPKDNGVDSRLSLSLYLKETSCLTAIESGMAGVEILTTNLGALPGTCGPFATFIPFHDDKNLLADQYAKALDQLCDQYWSEENHAMLKKQKMYFEDHWSWDQRIHEWTSLFESIQVT